MILNLRHTPGVFLSPSDDKVKKNLENLPGEVAMNHKANAVMKSSEKNTCELFECKICGLFSNVLTIKGILVR